MKIAHKNFVMAIAVATSFSVSAPTLAIAAKDDKKQCSLDEKWDKQKKKCVEKSSY